MGLAAKSSRAKRLRKPPPESLGSVYGEPQAGFELTPVYVGQEEAVIDAPLEAAGTLLFLIEGTDWAFHIDVFVAWSYSGVPTE